MGRLGGKFLNNTVGNAASFSVGLTAGRTLTPVVQDLVNEAWERHPSLPVDPQEVAQGVAEGVIPYNWGEDEAKRSGINAARFAYMVATAGNAPSTGELFALRNRGEISDAELDDGLEQNGIRKRWRADLAKLRQILVPASDLVRMAVREVFSPEQRAALDLDKEFPDAVLPHSRDLGLADEDMRNYWAAHWELPSYTQGTEMFFRGELTQAQFEGLLKAQDYAPTWRAKLLEIARAIPGISDMIRFAVREVYDPVQRKALSLDADYPAEFTAQAAKHGMRESDAKDYWAAHWQLPSATQGYHMLWRGEINEAQLDGLLKALDYAPVWRDKLANIAHLVPGRVDLRRMLEHGVITREEVKQGYIKLGYTPKDAETLTQFAEELAKPSASTRQSYTDKAETQLWTRLHTSYLAGDTNDAQARDKLATIGVPQNERDDVLRLWKEEREVIRQRLTPAQVKKAWAKAVPNPATGQPWSFDDALAELLSRGWSNQDARTFLAE